MQLDLFSVFRNTADFNGVLFYFNGSLSQNVIATMGDALKQRLDSQDTAGPKARRLFSSFMIESTGSVISPRWRGRMISTCQWREDRPSARRESVIATPLISGGHVSVTRLRWRLPCASAAIGVSGVIPMGRASHGNIKD